MPDAETDDVSFEAVPVALIVPVWELEVETEDDTVTVIDAEFVGVAEGVADVVWLIESVRRGVRVAQPEAVPTPHETDGKGVEEP